MYAKMFKKGVIGGNVLNWLLWISFILIALAAVIYLINFLTRS